VARTLSSHAMTRLLRVLVSVVAFSMPIVLGAYHSSVYFGAWNNIGVRYNPIWLVLYGLAFVAAAFVFGVPSLVHRPDQVLLGSLLAATTPLATASIVFVLYDPLVPRLVVVGTAAFLFVAFVVLSSLHTLFHRRSDGTDRVVFVVGHDEWVALERELELPVERKFVVAGVREPAEVEAEPDWLSVIGSMSTSVLVLNEVAQLSEPIVAHAARFHATGLRVRSLTAFYEEWLGKLPVADLERSSLWFDIRDLHELHYTRLKRVMDLLIAVVLLPVFMASVPVVVLGNALGNRGPLLFRQLRVGQHGTEFMMWKYRSMVARDSDDGAGEWTAHNDPRITRFGGILRKSHLDELPQVVNVLAGHLSVVGPRPEQLHYVRELERKIPFYAMRHLVKPGITGWAQVKYPYGASEQDALEKLQYELFYLKHQSPALDVKICARTVRSVVVGDGR
jgi:lipopolysaccharide/colanic/teichoic acid biosynthesis glycosyltransferase